MIHTPGAFLTTKTFIRRNALFVGRFAWFCQLTPCFSRNAPSCFTADLGQGRRIQSKELNSVHTLRVRRSAAVGFSGLGTAE